MNAPADVAQLKSNATSIAAQSWALSGHVRYRAASGRLYRAGISRQVVSKRPGADIQHKQKWLP